MGIDNGNPLVTVITATYNRSNVLRYSIESVLGSTFTDWELLVIGDACTDDTAEVVASFNDPRIRFINLPVNFGEQSGPNNEGIRLARGKFIAFLNHDDLYFPDHLGSSVDLIEQSGADLVFSAILAAMPLASNALARGELRFKLLGASPTGRYEPFVFAPASSWLLRRDLIKAIGGWHPAYRCYAEPSQEFLFRAWREGRDLRFKAQATVLAVQSGGRTDVYKKREEQENRFYAQHIKSDPRFRERILSQIAMDSAGRAAKPEFHFSVKRMLRKLIYRPALWTGTHPRALRAFFKYRYRGAVIDGLRRSRGLEPLKPQVARRNKIVDEPDL